MLWTAVVLCAASWAYLIGTSFPSFGETRVLIFGYLIGLIIGNVLIVLAVGVPTFRYGVDAIDLAKASLGTRGSGLLLVLVLASCLGWAFVLMAMTARGLAHLVTITGNSVAAPPNESVVVTACLGLLLLIWLLVRRGPTAMERLANICAPGQVLIALIILGLVAAHYGGAALLGHGLPATPSITTDPLRQLAYGVEFGFDNAMSNLPFLGGITRLVKFRRHLVGPTVVGAGILGAALVASVAAIGAKLTGGSDPIVWIVALTGNGVGFVIVCFLLTANLGTLVVLVYVASVAVQQLRLVARMSWAWIITITLTPGLIVAFRTAWVLDHVMTWLAYNGVMYVGLAAVFLSDFFFIRGMRLKIAHLFARSRQGTYWYWGGVNWIAMGVIAVSAATYLMLFNPVSYRVQPMFRFFGAGIPAVAIGCACYVLAMRLIWRGNSTGSASGETTTVVEVGL